MDASIHTAAPDATAAPAQPTISDLVPSFFAQLAAAAAPRVRRGMIGEGLHALISRSQPARAGKITGMLLEGMDEGELLRLLKSPGDLEKHIREALGVLARAGL